MRRGDLVRRDEGYDPHLFGSTKLRMQKILMLETFWVLLCFVLVISLIFDRSSMTPRYWALLGHYMASLLVSYVFDI